MGGAIPEGGETGAFATVKGFNLDKLDFANPETVRAQSVRRSVGSCASALASEYHAPRIAPFSGSRIAPFSGSRIAPFSGSRANALGGGGVRAKDVHADAGLAHAALPAPVGAPGTHRPAPSPPLPLPPLFSLHFDHTRRDTAPFSQLKARLSEANKEIQNTLLANARKINELTQGNAALAAQKGAGSSAGADLSAVRYKPPAAPVAVIDGFTPLFVVLAALIAYMSGLYTVLMTLPK